MTDTEMEARLEAIEKRLDALEAFVQSKQSSNDAPPPIGQKAR